jgi:hypothetical protein
MLYQEKSGNPGKECKDQALGISLGVLVIGYE